MYYYILEKHHAYVISALVYSSPVFTVLFAHMVLKERVTVLGMAGVLLIVTGVVLLGAVKRPTKYT